MIKPEIHPLFPTPVMMFNMNREFTKEEHRVFKDCAKNMRPNEGNKTSDERYILDKPEMSTLNTELTDMVRLYMDAIINPSNKVSPYITQSWLNYTKEGQWHHKHEHPNSFISGVLYIDADAELDKINFYRPYPQYQQIKLNPKDWNQFNSESWWFSVKTGMLVLFPSYLTHMVEAKKGKNTRTSLAFNTFLKGTIGSYDDLTELKNE